VPHHGTDGQPEAGALEADFGALFSVVQHHGAPAAHCHRELAQPAVGVEAAIDVRLGRSHIVDPRDVERDLGASFQCDQRSACVALHGQVDEGATGRQVLAHRQVLTGGGTQASGNGIAGVCAVGQEDKRALFPGEPTRCADLPAI
jgi:hypothetical protein